MGMMFARCRPIARLAASTATGVAPSAGEQEIPPAPPSRYVAPPPASTGGEVDELSRLAQMHDAGSLTADEFTAAKAQLLGT